MTGSTFEEARLAGIAIKSGDWSYTNLRLHNFKGCTLAGINFFEADLYQCCFDHADLRGANLSNAQLLEATFQSADLRGAKIGGAVLSKANIKGARIDVGQAISLAQGLGARVE